MKRVVSLLCAFLICVGGSAVARAELGADVRAILQDKLLARARVGVKLVKLGDSAGEVVPLFQANPADPLIPASNLKVVTTSAALDGLGADFKFRTLLLRHDQDLVLIGDGDPAFGDAELLKKSGWDVDTVFKTWAAGLARRKTGPARVLRVDDSVFDDEFVHPRWPADQEQKRYMAEVAGLNLNANCLDVYVKPAGGGQVVNYLTDPATHYVAVKNTCVASGENHVWLSREPGKNDLILRGQAAEANEAPVSVTIHDPPMYAGTVLAEALADAGVKVGGVARDRAARAAYAEASAGGGAGWAVLAVNETPLTAVIARANKDSMNLYAECCCKRLGFARRAPAPGPTAPPPSGRSSMTSASRPTSTTWTTGAACRRTTPSAPTSWSRSWSTTSTGRTPSRSWSRWPSPASTGRWRSGSAAPTSAAGCSPRAGSSTASVASAATSTPRTTGGTRSASCSTTSPPAAPPGRRRCKSGSCGLSTPARPADAK